MKKAVFFKLGGRFAHFKFPYTSPNYLKKSFSIPPKTTLLGILGSILGLKGFQQYDSEKEPEYYAKLKHIPIAIGLHNIPEKTLVTYNSINSFAKNIKDDKETSPIVNIKEEILLNPAYRIGLLLDESEETDNKLLEAFSQKPAVSSKFHLYLGKNEFFATISDVTMHEEAEFSFEQKQQVKHINSIIPLEIIDLASPGNLPGTIIYDSFSKNVSFKEKKLKTKLCEVAYFLEEDRTTIIELKKSTPLLTLGEEHYYFFQDEHEPDTSA